MFSRTAMILFSVFNSNVLHLQEYFNNTIHFWIQILFHLKLCKYTYVFGHLIQHILLSSTLGHVEKYSHYEEFRNKITNTVKFVRYLYLLMMIEFYLEFILFYVIHSKS